MVKESENLDLKTKILEIVEASANAKGLKKGINETTKAVERGNAKIVVLAEDVEPKEIVMHFPSLCKEKKIEYAYVPKREELGKAAGLKVPTAAVAVVKSGSAEKELEKVIKKLESTKKGE